MDIKNISQKWSELDESNIGSPMTLKLSKRDKRFLIGGFVVAFAITVAYWFAGGRNLFVFPATLCIALIVKSFVGSKSGRRGYNYFTRGTRTLPIRRTGK